VTTQNTQQDHSDVDATVVEHPSTLEASVDSIASETTTPTEAEEQVSTSSIEPVVSADAVIRVTDATDASDETAASPSSELPQEASDETNEATNEGGEESTPLTAPPVQEVPTSEAPASETEK